MKLHSLTPSPAMCNQSPSLAIFPVILTASFLSVPSSFLFMPWSTLPSSLDETVTISQWFSSDVSLLQRILYITARLAFLEKIIELFLCSEPPHGPVPSTERDGKRHSVSELTGTLRAIWGTRLLLPIRRLRSGGVGGLPKTQSRRFGLHAEWP